MGQYGVITLQDVIRSYLIGQKCRNSEWKYLPARIAPRQIDNDLNVLLQGMPKLSYLSFSYRVVIRSNFEDLLIWLG